MWGFLITWLCLSVVGAVILIVMELFFPIGEKYEQKQNRIRKQIEDENL